MSRDASDFRGRFRDLFDDHFPRLFRYLDRLTGDPELAADLAQETFMKLYARGAVPDDPAGWLIAVAMNLVRNAHAKRTRRRRLLTGDRGARSRGDAPRDPLAITQAHETRRAVREALDGLAERERSLLLLRAEGYSYRELARALDIQEGSVGTLLSRARRRFRQRFERDDDAS